MDSDFAAAVLLLVGYGSDRAAYGLNDAFSESVKLDSIMVNRAAKLASIRKPRLGSRTTFGTLASAVLNKSVYMDDNEVIVDNEVEYTVKASDAWKEVIESIPGLKSKLQSFRESIKDKIIGNDLKI